MKKETEKKGLERKVMTYRNNNKRVIRLAKLGLIEEIKPDAHTVNIHGRRDYKVTMKGLKYLIPYITSYPEPEDINVINEYMDKFGLNKKAFAERLFNRAESVIQSTDEYLRYAKLDPLSIDTDSITQLQRRIVELSLRLKILQSAHVGRSRRQFLAQQQVVKSSIKTERIKSDSGRNIDITEIMPSERTPQTKKSLLPAQRKKD
jgi:hypothetical protein